MEFGKVNEAELDKINFKLPQEPAFNKEVLKGEPVKSPKIYMGCAKWGRAEWVGKIYPLKTKEKDFLKYYSEHYNSIELNATHYKMYDETMIKKWDAMVGDRNFKFCPKMNKDVTHSGNLAGKEFISNEFLKGVAAFGKHLGPIFIQVSESFSPKRKDEPFDTWKLYQKTLNSL